MSALPNPGGPLCTVGWAETERRMIEAEAENARLRAMLDRRDGEVAALSHMLAERASLVSTNGVLASMNKWQEREIAALQAKIAEGV